MKNTPYSVVLLLLLMLILLSCANKEPKQTERSTKITIETQAIDSTAMVSTQVQATAVVADKPHTPSAQNTVNTNKQTNKVTPPADKKKSNKEEPILPPKRNSGLAKENTPQKIIGNQYFDVVEGYYCNDNYFSNPNSPGCTNCRFCREIFVKNKSKEHLFIKEVWCGNTKKEVNMWVEAGGIGEHVVFCISALINVTGLTPPIPYQGQALISYTVGNPNGEVQYFDVTNLLKSCGNFYSPPIADPK